MLDIIQSHQDEVERACQKFRVRSLALFGSAARPDFEPATSDLDFVVEFILMDPAEHAHSYFGLANELERIFKRKIDLLEQSAIRNPYIRRNIEGSREFVYAA